MVGMRSLFAALAVMCAVGLVAVDTAEARRGMSIGSRGGRTMQAPAPTPTAPAAAPIQRTTTPQANPQAARAGQQAGRPSMFGSGLGGSLMRGLLIGGLIGMLLGGGFGGLAGILGLLVQGALIALVVMLAIRFFRSRNTPAPAAAGAGAYGSARAYGPGPAGPGAAGPSPAAARPAPAPAAAAAAPAAAPRRGPGKDEIGLTATDLDTFERLLSEVHQAFGREDQATLKAHTTPEVFGYLADDLRTHIENGTRNVVDGVRMLQGDIAESWREGERDYATVAMRYESRDSVVDRTTGAFVSGDRDQPGETTEVWTFTRTRGGPWVVSAIQS